MTVSDRGLALTKACEGLELEAYKDGGGVWTIGYGHTGPDVHQGLVWTPNHAGAALQQDMVAAVTCVNQHVTHSISQCQFDALVDFTFNVGRGAFQTSTLLKKVNAGDFQGAALEFAQWIHDNGKIVDGLVRRRGLEAAMFREGM